MRTMSSAWGPAFPGALAGAGVLPTVVVAYAVALILYLPVEPALLSGLPSTAYWILRLLPDGLVAGLALAVVLLGDRTARTVPVRVLWAVAAVCMFLIAVNAARGVSVVDSINAVRLVVRHMVLGLLVWWAVGDRALVGPLVVRAVLAAGLVQIVISAVQIVARIIPSVGGTIALDPSVLLFIDGSLGRYDRLGLLLMSVAIAAVATDDRITRSRFALLAACMVLLYLTTSRQAMAGLATAGALLGVFPNVVLRRRALALVLAVLSVAFVLAMPVRLPPLPSEDPEAIIAASPAPSLSPAPEITKDRIQFTVDPNRNFRLFYILELAPWAAVTEPLIGFGPRQQVAEQPDPRLVARVEAAGMNWSWARRFTNDSNYASLVIQFGLVAPVLFLLLILSVTARAARAAIRAAGGFARFAVVNSVAVLVTAWFGPAFEIRMVSIILWVSLMAAIATLQRPGAHA